MSIHTHIHKFIQLMNESPEIKSECLSWASWLRLKTNDTHSHVLNLNLNRPCMHQTPGFCTWMSSQPCVRDVSLIPQAANDYFYEGKITEIWVGLHFMLGAEVFMNVGWVQSEREGSEEQREKEWGGEDEPVVLLMAPERKRSLK